MGKTAKGAVWLDPEKTSPYEFYQYWRNTADEDVEKCMKLLTFLPLDEIAELTAHRDERMNRAKEVLAYELTKMVHGEEKAEKAQSEARGAFGRYARKRDRKGHAESHRRACGGGTCQIQRRGEKAHRTGRRLRERRTRDGRKYAASRGRLCACQGKESAR